ncbi:MAG: T9SS type A sorting domain-containing protein [Bacteroidetes bacterium]|nr:T9SS type A sorting domain-containing protein [Bacteroidota bacterium]
MGGINILNSAPAIYFKILASGASGTSPIYIDNLQIAASYMNISTHGIKNFPRGMYVQDFIKFIGDPEGLIVDRGRTILGNPTEEDKLLNYCKKNNFTYLVFYDLGLLRYIYDRNDPRTSITFGEELCHFLKKAEDYYCLTDFGVAGSRNDFFSSQFDNNQSPVYNLTSAEKSLLSENSPVRLVEQILPTGDPRIPMVEYFKFLLTFTNINTPNSYRSSALSSSIQCSDAHFNVITAENEFWNDRSKTDINSTPNDNPLGNQAGPQYREFLTLARGMNDIKRIQENAGNVIYTELYLAYLEDTCSCNWGTQPVQSPNLPCTTNTTNYALASGNIAENQYVANTLDPLFDRFLSTYYSSDEFQMYNSSIQYYHQNYDSKFLSLGRSNPSGTMIQPLYSAESIPSNGQSNFYGFWFAGYSNYHGRDPRSFNIYTAEKNFYDLWFADNSVDAKDNPQMPGTSHWFASASLLKNTSNPQVLRSNSPLCTGTNSTALVTFTYQGPINKGSRYDFKITKNGVVYANLVDQEWPEYDANAQSGINLPSYNLPFDDTYDYDVQFKIYYNRHPSGCEYEETLQVKVKSGASIEANKPTAICREDFILLTASEGGTSYSWSNVSQSNGRFATIFNASSTGLRTVTCSISGGTCPMTANLPVTINPNYSNSNLPPALTSAACSPSVGGATITGFASTIGSTNWNWGDGTTGFPKQINESTLLSIHFTQTSGCDYTKTYNFTMPNLHVVSGESNVLCTNNSSVNLIVDNGGIYSLNSVFLYKNGVQIANLTTPFAYNASTSGTYTVSGILDGICITSQPIEVISSSGLVIPSTTVCAGQHPSPPVQCNARGSSSGITFNWYENGSLIPDANRYFVTVAPTSTSVYSCSITTTAGCTANSTGTVTVNPNPTITSAISQTTCTGICAGQIALTASGGSSFSYKWGNGGPTTSTVTNLCAGEYNVVVTNNLGCKATATPTVLQTTSGNCTADLEICSGQKSSDLIHFGTYHPGQSVVIHADLTIDQDFSFVNSDVILDPNVKIIINTGIRLTIDNSVLRKCPSLAKWYGIVVDQDGTSLIVRNNSTLKEAINAIDAKNGGRVAAMNSSFLYNEVSISFNGGDCFHSEIFGNTFDFGNTNIFDKTAEAHIKSNNTSYLKIGKIGEVPNLFTHGMYGIYMMDNVDGIIENNEFTAIGQLVPNDNYGYDRLGSGISAAAAINSTGISLKIRGSNSTNDKNYFHDIETSGIHIEKYILSDVFGNDFQNVFSSMTLYNCPRMNINIHNNHFKNYNGGIELISMSNSIIHVDNNDFNMEVSSLDTALSLPLTYPINHYGLFGITMQNSLKAKVEFHCNNNWISNTKYAMHIRNVTNVNTLKLHFSDNQIFFSKPVKDISGFEKGLWIENADYLGVYRNVFKYSEETPSTLSDAQQIIGIEFAYMQFGLIQQNKIINFGFGMHAKGDCSDTKLQCNNFFSYQTGLRCNNTDQPKLPTQGVNLVSWNNIWNPLSPNIFDNNFKIGGKPLFQIEWFYISGDQKFSPIPYEYNILPDDNPITSICTSPDFTPEDERSYKYSANLNSTLYSSDPDSLYHEYLGSEYFLRGFNIDSALLNLNTVDDSNYISKYYSYKNNNQGKYDDIRKLLNQKNTSDANTKLQNIVNLNTLELNKKIVYSAYERMINDSAVLDTNDVEDLNLIAYQLPLYGGEAVYDARALLKLFVEDDELTSLRKRKPDFYLPTNEHERLKQSINSFEIFPNPTSGQFTIIINNEPDQNSLIKIVDNLGRTLQIIRLNGQTLSYNLDINYLMSGIYFVNYLSNNKVVLTKKLVLIK